MTVPVGIDVLCPPIDAAVAPYLRFDAGGPILTIHLGGKMVRLRLTVDQAAALAADVTRMLLLAQTRGRREIP